MRLHAHYTQRLADLRVQNDGDKDDIWTARQRGRIAEIKILLDLGEEHEVAAQQADSIADAMSFANE